MADEYVSAAQFGEFVKRIDERFDDVEKELASVNKLADQRYESINQLLADADKARDQNLVHVNQRFDDMNRSMNQRFDDVNRNMSQRFDILDKRFEDQRRVVVFMWAAIVAAVVGTAVKYLETDGTVPAAVNVRHSFAGSRPGLTWP